MSARPAFTNLAPRTQFAGGIHPWTQQPMPTMSPARPSASPFPSATLDAPKKRRGQPRIDTSTLKIRSNVPLPTRRVMIGKYDEFFSKLKPKQCIECKPDEVNPISQALRKYLRDHKKAEGVTIVVQQNCEDNPAIGRVWLWPADEIGGAAATRPRGEAADHRSPRAKAAK